MPIKSYGVLRGKATESKLAGKGGNKPHYQIHIKAAGEDHRIAVNVVSDQAPSELLFLLNPDFQHPVLKEIGAVGEGFHAIPSQPGGLALDFIRGGDLFDPTKMTALPFDTPGPDNDLHEIFDLYVKRAIDRGADVYAFGSKWGPETQKDDYFGFKPGNGIHDIHLNQGSPAPHKGDNGIWQDGALFIHFPAENKWLAFFLAFQSQFGQTDEHGDALPGSPKFGKAVTPVTGGGGTGGTVTPVEVPATAGVHIVAALVNPPGDDAGHETVTLLNARPEAVNLSGWKIANATGGQLTLHGPVLAPGDTTRIPLTDLNVPLSNKGGTISLLDPKGIKVDGVAYTKEQVAGQGWTNVF